MKKLSKWASLAAMMLSLVLVGCKSGSQPKHYDWEFEVGSDAVTAESEGASSYSPTYTVNLKVVGGGDAVLFNGTVTLKSPTMWASEFLKEAVTDKGLAQEGIDVGFVTTIGDYVNNGSESTYWTFTVNGKMSDWAVNAYQLRDGDYMLWTYAVVDWNATPVIPEIRSGEWEFEVGTDEVNAESEGATAYSATYKVNLKVVGGNDTVLFNGVVNLKSPTMWASEFLKEAVTDKGLAQEGIDVGFVTTIGDYVNNGSESIYWGYTVNGKSADWGCNALQMRDGDYMLWTYAVVVW